MSKIVERDKVAQEISDKICQVFNINPSDVNVNHRSVTGENGEEMEVVDCSINLANGCDKVKVEQTIVPWDDVLGVNVTNVCHDLFSKLNSVLNDERVTETKKSLKDAIGRLVEAINGRDTEEFEEEDENGAEYEECCCGDCECDDCECGETHCCECGVPCVIEDKSANLPNIPTASEIKDNLQKKFEAVIRQQKEEKRERDFYQSLKDALLTLAVKKIQSEEYQSLTNDLNAEGAGIYIVLSEQETTDVEVETRWLYNYDARLDFDYLESEVVNRIASEICEHLGFHDSIGYIDDKGQTILKLWFNK